MYFLKQIFKVSFLLIFLSFGLFAQTNEEDTEAGSPANCPSCEDNSPLIQLTKDILGVPKRLFINEFSWLKDTLLSPHTKGKAKMNTCDVIYSTRNFIKSSLIPLSLSDYWAQEMIGADLLREELEKVPPPKTKNFIAVFDTSTNNHNVHVKNLISDEGTQAILPELKDQIVDVETKYSSQDREAAERFLRRWAVPSFINNSMSWVSRTTYDAYKSLSPPSVIVTASGNEYPIGVEQIKSEASKEFSAILVGSFSPTGRVSAFSSSGEEVHILAPSDHFLTSADDQGKYREFAGTSGAAPLVTGSLAGFEWLSGYHPTAKESKRLLEKTALPTLESFEKPRRNGVGLLNTYKLGMVAKRLRKKCKNKKSSCFKKEIENNENYRFQVDPNLEKELTRVFPSCAMKNESEPQEKVVSSSCEDQKKVFKQLRKASLLTSSEPARKKYLDSLSCIYEEKGFSQNAKILKRLAKATCIEAALEQQSFNGFFDFNSCMYLRLDLVRGGDRGIRLLQDLEQDPDFNVETKKEIANLANVMRDDRGFEWLQKLAQDPDSNAKTKKEIAYQARMMGGDRGIELFQILAQDSDPDVRLQVVTEAIQLEGDRGFEILRMMAQDSSVDVRKKILSQMWRMEGERGLEWLKLWVEDPDPDIKKKVAFYAQYMGGDRGFEILEKLAQDSDPDIKKKVAFYAQYMGGDRGFEILEKLAQDSDPDVKKLVAYYAKEMGGERGFKLLQILAKDSDPDVRSTVAYYAQKMGGDLGIELLRPLIEDPDPDVRRMAAYYAKKMGGKGLELLIREDDK